VSCVEIHECRSCGSKDLHDIFSLGEQHIKDFVDTSPKEFPKAPLDLVLCRNCYLFQLKHTFNQDTLYSKYWYRSGTSPTMVKALQDIVSSATKYVELSTGDIVVDIGANDGTLLSQYNVQGITKIGFEPSNLWKDGIREDTKIINNYFNAVQFKEIFSEKKAKIITSIAMFYDLVDPNSFVSDIKKCLHEEGLWIIQMNYLGLMFNNLGYDNILHEHLEYHSLLSLKYLLDRHDFEISDVELNDVNAGSYRVFITHKNTSLQLSKDGKKRVSSLIAKEQKKGFLTLKPYEEFAVNIAKSKNELQSLFNNITKNNKTVFVYGASTRGLVILEHMGITNNDIPFATDNNSDKWGLIMAGTGIPIVSLEKYREMNPDYLLVLPYQYINEIAKQEKDFLEKGGKMIIPLPHPKIIDSSYLDSLNDTDSTIFTPGYDQF
jgi:NDP-4-keto-2,6-dideoxyhexose 3-C-methyltransferase